MCQLLHVSPTKLNTYLTSETINVNPFEAMMADELNKQLIDQELHLDNQDLLEFDNDAQVNLSPVNIDDFGDSNSELEDDTLENDNDKKDDPDYDPAKDFPVKKLRRAREDVPQSI